MKIVREYLFGFERSEDPLKNHLPQDNYNYSDQGMTEILKHGISLPHELIQEIYHFQRGIEPKESMDIGNKNYQIINKTQQYLDRFAPGSKITPVLPSDKKWLDWDPIQKWELPNKDGS